MPDRLLTLVAQPALQERMIDVLLESGFAGFTSFECAGHGVDSATLSVSEQVAGRERRIGFWIHVDEPGATAVIEAMACALGESRVHYWIAPLLEQGRIGTGSRTEKFETTTNQG